MHSTFTMVNKMLSSKRILIGSEAELTATPFDVWCSQADDYWLLTNYCAG